MIMTGAMFAGSVKVWTVGDMPGTILAGARHRQICPFWLHEGLHLMHQGPLPGQGGVSRGIGFETARRRNMGSSARRGHSLQPFVRRPAVHGRDDFLNVDNTRWVGRGRT